MKGYSLDIPENCATARVEGVNASHKDLAEVCGRIQSRKTAWAIAFLEKVAEGQAPVFYRRRNKRLGHRRELGGRKGRYPEKAARIVLKALKSAMANGRNQGLGDDYTILSAAANKKHTYPRLAAKGRRMRASLTTSRIEIVLKGPDVPKGVTVTPPAKKEEKPKAPEKKPEPKKKPKPVAPEAKPEKPKQEAKAEKKPEAPKQAAKPKEAEASKEEAPVIGKQEKKEPQHTLKQEEHEHKHELEKSKESEKKRKDAPHQHGEHNKG